MDYRPYNLDLGLLDRTALIFGLFFIIFLLGLLLGINIEWSSLKQIETVLEASIGSKIEFEQAELLIDEPKPDLALVLAEPEPENNPEPASLVLIQEKLDDISEKIDILSQEVAELTGEKIEQKIVLAEETEQEQEKEGIELEQEEEQEVEVEVAIKKEPIRVRSSGGGGTSKDDGPNYCDRALAGQPNRDKVIINEIAWMGTDESANNEWIELKNISDESVDISNWQILDKDEQIKIIFSQASISSSQFYLLERTNDNSVPNVSADYIYTGALNDTDEALYLFDNNCQVQDEAIADPSWPAGDKDKKKSMERGDDLFWHTYYNQGIGTPKAENSQLAPGQEGKCPDINNDKRIDVLDMVLVRNQLGQDNWDKDMDLNNDNYLDINDLEYLRSYLAMPLDEIEVCPKDEPDDIKILLNEIQIDSQVGTGGADDDWVELYNPNETDISLAGWSIQEHSWSDDCSLDIGYYKKNFPDEAVILSQGFFLIVDTEANDLLSEAADMEISWSLTNDNTIYLVKNQDKIENGNDIDIIDKVGFGQSCFPETEPADNPPEAKSIERKNLGLDTNNNKQDFEIKDIPSPHNHNEL